MKTPGNEEWAEAEGKKGFLERLMNLLGFETQIELEEVYDDPVPGAKDKNPGKIGGRWSASPALIKRRVLLSMNRGVLMMSNPLLTS